MTYKPRMLENNAPSSPAENGAPVNGAAYYAWLRLQMTPKQAELGLRDPVRIPLADVVAEIEESLRK